MAQRRHAVPHVGLGDHAPADARERRHSVLRALHGRAARRRGVSHRAGGTALEALGGARLLLAGAESAKGGKGHRLGLWRRVAAHLCKSQNAPRHRRLHRRRHRLDQLRRAGRRGGRESAARRRARQRLRRRHHGREGTKAIHRASQRRHRLSPPRRVQSGDDGPRRDGVPAERRAEVRDLPRANDVRGVQKRPHRSLTRAREEKGAQD